jgi:hypothetical protein
MDVIQTIFCFSMANNVTYANRNKTFSSIYVESESSPSVSSVYKHEAVIKVKTNFNDFKYIL